MVKRAAKKRLFDKLSERASRIAAFISASLIIIGALTGASSWVSGQFANAVSSQINDFRNETRDSNMSQEQAITRIELIILMEHDPDNIVAIEKMARRYFQELGGNLYMTQKYSEWAKAHGGDISIVIGGK